MKEITILGGIKMEKFIITEKMVMALLGKGMIYEIEDMEMEYEISVPLDVFDLGDDEEHRDMDINIKMKMSGFRFEIQKS